MSKDFCQVETGNMISSRCGLVLCCAQYALWIGHWMHEATHSPCVCCQLRAVRWLAYVYCVHRVLCAATATTTANAQQTYRHPHTQHVRSPKRYPFSIHSVIRQIVVRLFGATKHSLLYSISKRTEKKKENKQTKTKRNTFENRRSVIFGDPILKSMWLWWTSWNFRGETESCWHIPISQCFTLQNQINIAPNNIYLSDARTPSSLSSWFVTKLQWFRIYCVGVPSRRNRIHNSLISTAKCILR